MVTGSFPLLLPSTAILLLCLSPDEVQTSATAYTVMETAKANWTGMENLSGFRDHMHTSLLLCSGYVRLLVLQPIGYRAHGTQCAVQTFPVIEYFDVIKDIPA